MPIVEGAAGWLEAQKLCGAPALRLQSVPDIQS